MKTSKWTSFNKKLPRAGYIIDIKRHHTIDSNYLVWLAMKKCCVYTLSTRFAGWGIVISPIEYKTSSWRYAK
jgi:hypothetical protein